MTRKSTIAFEGIAASFFEETINILPDDDTIGAALKGIGNMWDFDIWFIHNTWGKDMAPMSNYIFEKYRFAELLNY
jgi:hypothetical protein